MPSNDSSSDPDDLYPVVRRAVEDALWNVAGSIVYGLFLVLLGLVGVSLLLTAVVGDTSVTATLVAGLLGGGAVLGAAVGLYRIATD